jgi:hypothetical protein
LGLGFPNPLFAQDAKPAGDFSFLVINDVHYFDRACGEWFAKVLDGARKHQPDFCLVVGDLAEDGSVQQLGPMRELLAILKMPVHVVIGNHDYTADNGRKPFEDAFPHSLNYIFEHKGWQFIGLDTTQGRAGSNTVIAKETLDFLAAALKKFDAKKPTVLFTHFPLGWLLPSRPNNAQALLGHFVDHNLQHVFNGHFHSATTRVWGPCELTTNTCCSLRKKNHDFDPRKGYFLCTTREGAVKRKYIQVNG